MQVLKSNESVFLAVIQFRSPFPDLLHNNKDKAVLHCCFESTAEQAGATTSPLLPGYAIF